MSVRRQVELNARQGFLLSRWRQATNNAQRYWMACVIGTFCANKCAPRLEATILRIAVVASSHPGGIAFLERLQL